MTRANLYTLLTQVLCGKAAVELHSCFSAMAYSQGGEEPVTKAFSRACAILEMAQMCVLFAE